MTFLITALLLPALSGLLLGQFAGEAPRRNHKAAKKIAWSTAVVMAVVSVVYGLMSIDCLVRFFTEPGADEIYAVITAYSFAVIIRPAIVGAVALIVTSVGVTIRVYITNQLIKRLVDEPRRRSGKIA